MIFKACKYKFILLLTLAAFAISCESNTGADSEYLLKQAAKTVEDNPREALKTLYAINTGELSENSYYYYTLLQLKVRRNTGENISDAQESAENVKAYFISAGNTEKIAYAYYVAGLVYLDQNNIAKALYNFMAAEDWAQKTNCQISDLNYSLIDYNIALMYYHNKQYKQAIEYIHKTEQHAKKPGDMLHVYELASLIYKNLNQADSAWFYINKEIINLKPTDSVNLRRVWYNRCVILMYAEKFDFVEEKCNELLSDVSGKDSYREGLTYMVISFVNSKKVQTNEAYKYAYMAKNLLVNIDDLRLKQRFFETLYLAEKGIGNSAKAAEYKKMQENFVAQWEARNTAQRTELEQEITTKNDEIFNIKYQQRLAVKQSQKDKNILFIVATIFLLLIIFILTLWRIHSKRIVVPKVVKIQADSILASLKGKKREDPNKQLMERVNEIIDKNLWNPEFTIEQVVPLVNVSRAVLYAKIKVSSEVTPNNIIKLKRLQKAAEYLAEGHYRINEVCYRVGFNSPSYFAKCFYKQFGVLPKEFIEKIKNENNDLV